MLLPAEPSNCICLLLLQWVTIENLRLKGWFAFSTWQSCPGANGATLPFPMTWDRAWYLGMGWRKHCSARSDKPCTCWHFSLYPCQTMNWKLLQTCLHTQYLPSLFHPSPSLCSSCLSLLPQDPSCGMHLQHCEMQHVVDSCEVLWKLPRSKLVAPPG